MATKKFKEPSAGNGSESSFSAASLGVSILEIVLSQILEHIQLILGVGGGTFAVFQAMFFRTPIDFPIKPSHDFVLKSLTRRTNKLTAINIIYCMFIATVVLVIIERTNPESFWAWAGSFLLGFVGMAIVTFLVVPAINAMETRYVRAYLNSTSYTEDDYMQLINTIENKENDYCVDIDIIYDAIGLDKKT